MPPPDEVHHDMLEGARRVTLGIGVLRLALSAGSWAFDFVPQAGRTFADSGSGTCH